MALLQKIKEKLGFGSGDNTSGPERGETTVTVEHEPDESADGGEDGASASTTETAESPETTETAQTTETPTATEEDDIAEETVERDETDDGSGRDEVAETDAADEKPESGVVDEADATADGANATADGADATADEAAADDGTPVDHIKGIGPAYAERLEEIDIHTVADLAAADPADVAEGASVGEKRAAAWVDRASEF